MTRPPCGTGRVQRGQQQACAVTQQTPFRCLPPGAHALAMLGIKGQPRERAPHSGLHVALLTPNVYLRATHAAPYKHPARRPRGAHGPQAARHRLCCGARRPAARARRRAGAAATWSCWRSAAGAPPPARARAPQTRAPRAPTPPARAGERGARRAARQTSPPMPTPAPKRPARGRRPGRLRRPAGAAGAGCPRRAGAWAMTLRRSCCAARPACTWVRGLARPPPTSSWPAGQARMCRLPGHAEPSCFNQGGRFLECRSEGARPRRQP